MNFKSPFSVFFCSLFKTFQSTIPLTIYEFKIVTREILGICLPEISSMVLIWASNWRLNHKLNTKWKFKRIQVKNTLGIYRTRLSVSKQRVELSQSCEQFFYYHCTSLYYIYWLESCFFWNFFKKMIRFNLKQKHPFMTNHKNFLQNNNTFPYALKIVLRFWHFERSKVGLKLKTITKQRQYNTRPGKAIAKHKSFSK